MAVVNLHTDWKIIGRSGKTVDGREIPEAALIEAAASYKPELFTAMIWPEHQRGVYSGNFGKVSELKAAKNAEGGTDLLARLTPNEDYIYYNRNGQKLFTSMELTPNFRGSNGWYLTGLGATDSPASAATSEIRFSVTPTNTILSEFTALESAAETEEEKAPSWFTKFFNKQQDEPMTAAERAALEQRFAGIESALTKFAEQKPAEPAATDAKPSEKELQLSAELSQVKAEFDAYKQANPPKEPEKPAVVTAEAFNALMTQFNALQAEFKQATGEKNGTAAGEFTGDVTDLSQYV